MTQCDPATIQLFAHLHRGGEWAYLWTEKNKQTTWFPVSKPVPNPRGKMNLYFGVHPSAESRGKTQRARIKDIVAINCLYADIDAKSFENDKARAREHIESLPIEPSVIVDSGGGFHCYWLLRETFVIADDSDRERAINVQEQWVAFVGGDPNAKDLARILRVPGTLNHKYKPPRPVEFVHTDFERVYSLDELEAAIPRDEPLDPPAGSTARVSGNEYSRYALAALIDELDKLSRAREGARNDQLNKSAFAMGQWVGVSALDREDVEKKLADAARRLGLTEREIQATIRSGIEAGIKHPRVFSGNGSAQHTSLGSSSPANEIEPGWLGLTDIVHFLDRGEVGDAELFARLFADRCIFDHAEAKWSVWNGQSWERDDRRHIINYIANQVAAQYLHAEALARRTESLEAQKLAMALNKHLKELRYRNKISNILALAESQQTFALKGSEWDHQPLRLGVVNGTLNLATGKLYAGIPREYIRTIVPIKWEGLDVSAPRWNQFLNEIFAGDDELIAFVQRLLGYGLSGTAQEHTLPILYGVGRNGKDTLLETIKHILGDLAVVAPSDILIENSRNPNAPTPSLYLLRNRRIAWINETNRSARLNEAQVKWLTGGGTITARPLYGHPVTFRPHHLLMLVTNHLPQVSADDYATWERLLVIPFTQKFIAKPSNANEHLLDPELKNKLIAESSGILAWLVRGCLMWQEHGRLDPPESVRWATTQYQSGSDGIDSFIRAECTMDAGAKVQARDLYLAYVEWAGKRNLAPVSETKFGRDMSARFTKREGREHIYLGIGLQI